MLGSHVLHDIDLSNNQKIVLAKAVLSGALDSKVKVPLNTAPLVVARDLLDELGIIHYSHKHNTIKIHDEYVDFLKQEGVIDETNQLTPEVQELMNGNNRTTESMTFAEYYNLN
jgi:hypothetical protein